MTGINTIPFFESYDPVLQRLNLRWVNYFPEEIYDYADQIKILDVSMSTLHTLPDSFPFLHNLERVFLSENDFIEVPTILSKCRKLKMLSIKNGKLELFPEDSLPPSIEWLVLTDNPKLHTLPQSLGNLRHLRKLSLAGTGISELPESLSQCRNIEFLRISACQFHLKPPLWIFWLPKLAWYGDMGNPFSPWYMIVETVKTFHKVDVIIEEKINESPSSIVYKGCIKWNQEVVVIKNFKQMMTSDGYARDDLHMTILAGEHPHLIKIYGVMNSVEKDKLQYILSSYIAEDFIKLGFPPSLESCTRDTYSVDTIFTLSFIHNVCKSIASVLSHLHSRWICHGDLYAHNILVNPKWYAYLCDFWAATLYNPSENPHYQALDVRAFGCLLEELLDHIKSSENSIIVSNLRQLQSECQSENPENRPSFQDISSHLNSVLIPD